VKAAFELDRAAARAARLAAGEARAAVNRQVEQLLGDVEALVERLRDAGGSEIGLLRVRVQDAMEATKKAVANGDRYVRTRPWDAVALVASAGLLISVFVSGQRRRRLRRLH